MAFFSFSFGFYFLILISLLHNGASSQFFDSLPAFNIQTNYGKGSAIKISPDSLRIAIGFQYGSVAVYDITGPLLYACFGHRNHIIGIEWINDKDFISIDSIGKTIRWNEEGKQIIIWQINENVKDISVSTHNNQSYLAVNLGSSVMQFNANIQSDTPIIRYFPSHGISIDRIIYDKGHHMLFTATNTSLILAYSCQSGQMMPLIPIHTSYPILSFELMPNGYIAALTSNNFIIKFSTQLQFTSTYLYTPGSMMIVCPTGQSTNLFLISSQTTGIQSGKTILKVFSQQVKLQQELVNYTGDDNLIKGMDCSQGGLAVIDDKGFLTIGKYYHTDNISKNGNWWWILLIAITGVSFVVGLIMAVKRTKHKFTLIRKKSVHSHYAIIDETNLIKTNDHLENQRNQSME